MKLLQTTIPDVVIIEPVVFEDARGWFMESFNESRFHEALKSIGLPVPPSFVQDNHSCSAKGVLRGLHYQLPPYAQGKLVRVSQGSAFVVAVDIREDSPTFGQSASMVLDAIDHRMAWIPVGFAHGFLALEDNTHYLYKTTALYHKDSEASLRWNDPLVAISWPLTQHPVLIEKDKMAPCLTDIVKMPAMMTPQACFPGLVGLNVISDTRGSLVALEAGTNLPFQLKRVYYIFSASSGSSRGYHAHKNLQQLAVCLAGRCRMILDNGSKREEFWLDSPTKGLLISNMMWREMHDFSDDCVLVVFASELYDEADYIRDYDQFIKEALGS